MVNARPGTRVNSELLNLSEQIGIPQLRRGISETSLRTPSTVPLARRLTESSMNGKISLSARPQSLDDVSAEVKY